MIEEHLHVARVVEDLRPRPGLQTIRRVLDRQVEMRGVNRRQQRRAPPRLTCQVRGDRVELAREVRMNEQNMRHSEIVGLEPRRASKGRSYLRCGPRETTSSSPRSFPQLRPPS